MKDRNVTSKAVIVATWLFFPPSIFAQAKGFTLEHGTYVQGNRLQTAAPGSSHVLDGNDFSGPHSSKCGSHITGHPRNRFSVITTCAALGDGTPDISGYVDNVSLTRLSATSFILTKANQPKATYRWCATK